MLICSRIAQNEFRTSNKQTTRYTCWEMWSCFYIITKKRCKLLAFLIQLAASVEIDVFRVSCFKTFYHASSWILTRYLDLQPLFTCRAITWYVFSLLRNEHPHALWALERPQILLFLYASLIRARGTSLSLLFVQFQRVLHLPRCSESSLLLTMIAIITTRARSFIYIASWIF